ncbi:hypothetical protein ACOME3_002851 [Neoechinorhynchus agilis]
MQKSITSLNLFSLQKSVHIFPIFLLALSCHSWLLTIYSELGDTSVSEFEWIFTTATASSTIIYGITGFCGYVGLGIQGIKLQGNVVSVLTRNSPSYTFVDVIIATTCLLSVPLVVNPCRQNLYDLLFETENTSTRALPFDIAANIKEINRYIRIRERHKTLTIAILCFSTILCILATNLQSVLTVVGSLFGSFLSLILPSAMLIIARKKENFNDLNNTRFLKACFVTGAFTVLMSIMTISCESRKFIRWLI